MNASIVACVGLITLLLGYYLLGKGLLSSKSIRLELDLNKAKRLAIFCMLSGLASLVIRDQFTVPITFVVIINLIRDFIEIGIGIFVVLSLRGRLMKIENSVLWYLVIPVFFFFKLGTGSIASVIFPAVFILFFIWWGKKENSVARGYSSDFACTIYKGRSNG